MSSWSSEDEEVLRQMNLRRRNALQSIVQIAQLWLGAQADRDTLERVAGVLVLYADDVIRRLKPFCKGE